MRKIISLILTASVLFSGASEFYNKSSTEGEQSSAAIGKETVQEIYTDSTPSQPDSALLPPDSTPSQPDSAPSQPDSASSQPNSTPSQPNSAPSKPDSALLPPDSTPSQPNSTPSQPNSAPQASDKEQGLLQDDSKATETENLPQELFCAKELFVTEQKIVKTFVHEVNRVFTLKPLFVPQEMSNTGKPYTLTWENSDTDVALAEISENTDEAKITLKKHGTTVIKATAGNGKSVTYIIYSVPLYENTYISDMKLLVSESKFNIPQSNTTLRVEVKNNSGYNMSPDTEYNLKIEGIDAVYDKDRNCIKLPTVTEETDIIITAFVPDDPLERKFSKKYKVYPALPNSAVSSYFMYLYKSGNMRFEEKYDGTSEYVFFDGVPKGSAHEDKSTQLLVKTVFKDCFGNALKQQPKAVFTSSNPKVATVKYSDEGMNDGVYAGVAVKGVGTATITVKAAGASAATTTFKIIVRDYAPRAQSSNIKFSTAKEGFAEIAVNAMPNTVIKDISFSKDTKGSNDPRFSAQYFPNTESLKIISADSKAYTNAKTYLKCTVYENEYDLNGGFFDPPLAEGQLPTQPENDKNKRIVYLPVTITSSTSVPAPSISIGAAMDLYRSQTPQTTLKITKLPNGEKIKEVRITASKSTAAEPDGFTIVKNDAEDNSWIIKGDKAAQYLSENENAVLAKVNRAYMLEVYYEGYALPYKKAITVPAIYTTPKISLTPSTQTINTYSKNTAFAQFEIYDAKLNITDISSAEIVSAKQGSKDYKDSLELIAPSQDKPYFTINASKLDINKSVALNVVLKITSKGYSRPVNAGFKLTAINAEPQVKLNTSTVTLNMFNPNNGEALITAYVPNIPSAIFDEVEVIPNNDISRGAINIKQSSDGRIIFTATQSTAVNKTYSYTLIPKCTMGEITQYTMPKLTVTVKTTYKPAALKAAVTRAVIDKALLQSTEITLGAVFANSSNNEAQIQSGSLVLCDSKGNAFNEPLQNAPIITKISNSEHIVAPTSLTANGTYYFLAKALLKNTAGNANAEVSKIVAVKVINSAPLPSLTKASLKADVSFADCSVKTSFKPYNAKYGKIDIDKTHIKLLSKPKTATDTDIDVKVVNGEIIFTPIQTAPAGTYSFMLTPMLETADINGANVELRSVKCSVSVAKTTPTVKASQTSFVINRQITQTRLSFELTKPSDISGGAYGNKYDYSSIGKTEISKINGKPYKKGEDYGILPSFQLQSPESGIIVISYAPPKHNYDVKNIEYIFTPYFSKTVNAKPIKISVKFDDNMPEIAYSTKTVYFNSNPDTQCYAAQITASGFSKIPNFAPEKEGCVKIAVTDSKGNAAPYINYAVEAKYDNSMFIHFWAVKPISGSYKAKITFTQAPGTENELVFDESIINIVTTSKAVTYKVSAKGTTDLLNRDSTRVVYTVTPCNITLPVSYISMKAPDSNYITSKYEVLTDKVIVKATVNENFSPLKCSKISFSPEFHFKSYNKQEYAFKIQTPLTLTPKQSASSAKASVIGSNEMRLVLGAGQKVKVKVSMVKPVINGAPAYLAHISDIKLTAAQKAAFKISSVNDDGEFTITLQNTEALKSETVKLNLLAQPEGSAVTGGAPITVSISLKP